MGSTATSLTQSNIHSGSDIDYYQFAVPATSTGRLTIYVDPDPTLDAILQLFDADASLVASADIGGADFTETITYEGAVGANYYAKVTAWAESTGSYVLDLSFAQTQLPDTYEQINLRHLLTHTSGIRHYFHPQEAVEFGHCEQANGALHRFVNDSLVHRPGEQETYSTYGFVLASAMLEARSGIPFSDLLSRHLTPAAGVSLVLDSRNRPDSGLHFYDVHDDGEVTPALPIDNSCKMGGGGFRGSAQDLVAIYNAALNEELAPMPAISQLLGGRTSLTAGGSGVGGEAVSIIDFESRISVVLLSNTSGLEQRIALRRARDLLLSVFDDKL